MGNKKQEDEHNIGKATMAIIPIYISEKTILNTNLTSNKFGPRIDNYVLLW
jgi:hypothetical protein